MLNLVASDARWICRWALVLLIVSVSIGVLPSTQALAADTPRTLQVVTRAVPPFAYQNEQGIWQGIAIELWERAIADTGMRSEYRAASLKEMLDLVADPPDRLAPYRAHVGRLLSARGVIQALADRRIDVGPLDGYVFDLIRASDPAFAAHVKVIVTTDPTPMPPVIATAALAPAAIDAVRAAFLAVESAPELAATRATLLLDRFIVPAATDFDVQRARAAQVDAAGKHWE